jgi:ParB family chromosome partitioning protein
LEALIPTEATHDSEVGFFDLPISQIRPNPDQPRHHFDETTLAELTASLKEVGVLQPIVVTAVEDGYQLIAGERRLRAAREAGMTEIPAIVREAVGTSTLVEALVENVQRQDLTPIEEAVAYRHLLENYGMKQEEIATRVGKSRPAVSNTLRLLQLPDEIQSMVDEGVLSAGHVRPLVGMDDAAYAIHLAQTAADDGWSVRQVEEAVKTRKSLETPAPGGVRSLRPVEIIELEKRLTDQLGATVKISYRNQKGKVEIRFTSIEDLERLYRELAD